jgi:hypothetical protein
MMFIATFLRTQSSTLLPSSNMCAYQHMSPAFGLWVFSYLSMPASYLENFIRSTLGMTPLNTVLPILTSDFLFGYLCRREKSNSFLYLRDYADKFLGFVNIKLRFIIPYRYA